MAVSAKTVEVQINPSITMKDERVNPFELRMEVRKTERLAKCQPFLDLRNHGDIAVLHQADQMLIFIGGIPRACFTPSTGLLRYSVQLYRIKNSEWHFEKIYEVVPKWTRRQECRQPMIDGLVQIAP